MGRFGQGINQSGAWRRSLLTALLLGTSVSVATILPVQVARAQSDELRQYAIPAGTLSAALSAFGQQSGLQLSYLASATSGLSSSGFSGQARSADALAALLDGTGLSFSFIDAGTVAIAGGPAGGASVSPDGSIQLGEVNVTAWLESAGLGWDGSGETVYSTPAMVSHVSAETIEQYRGTSPSDILKGVPGLIAANGRTNGALEPNIQGMQGMGRVAVTVDGASNSMTGYHGYQGVTNRSYIDPDFIGSVAVQKGASIGTVGVGAIAGNVAMRTVTADDIIPEGQNSAIRVNLEASTNSSPSQSVGSRTLTRSLLGYLWTANEVGTPAAPLHDIDRPGLFVPSGMSGSVTYALRNDNVDLVLGAARRQSGNYHVGTTGGEAPEAADICATATGTMLNYCNRGSVPYTIGLTTYLPGEQVLNTSQDIFSTLAKASFRNGDHSLELSNTHYDSIYGETYPLGFVTAGQLTDQNLTSTVVLDTNTARYRWNPDSDLIDFRLNGSVTNMAEQTPADVGGSGISGKWAQMISTDVSNTSRLDTAIGPATLNYGASVLYEGTGPSSSSTSIGQIARDGERYETSAFLAASLSPVDWLQLDAGVLYHQFEAQDLSGSSLVNTGHREDKAWDYSLGASVTPMDGVQLFAKYNNAARMPSLFESVSNSLINIDPDLGAERASNWQLGANFTANDLLADGDQVSLKVGYFDNTISDYIYRRAERREILPGYFLTWLDITNLERAHFSGIEVAGQYDLGGFSALATGTYYTDVAFCRTVSTCGASSLASDYATNHVPPELSASLTLSQKLLEDRLTISGRGTYYGERAAGAEIPSSGAQQLIAAIPWKPVFILDAFAEYKLTDHAKLKLSVENIADTYYVDPLSIALVPAPGRTIKLGFSGTFSPDGGMGDFADFGATTAHDWTGFYLGGTVGNARTANRQEGYYSTRTGSTQVSGGGRGYEGGEGLGFVGGIRAGYDHQLDNNVVIGFDVDASWGSIEASQAQNNSATSPTMTTTYDMLASANLRVGLAHDNVLVYGKAGISAGHVENLGPYTQLHSSYQNDFQSEGTALGVAAGAGVEFALTDNISLFGEYQHMRLGSNASGTVTSSYTEAISFENRSSVDTVKAGFNFRF